MKIARLSCCALAGALLLGGCAAAAQHQVIGASTECSTCHSEEKRVFEGAEAPEDAVESGPRVEVRADAGAVVVCVPRFTAEDGSRFVPVESSRVSTDGGSAVLELEEGLWAVCVDDGDSARARLVHVDPSRSDIASIEL